MMREIAKEIKKMSIESLEELKEYYQQDVIAREQIYLALVRNFVNMNDPELIGAWQKLGEAKEKVSFIEMCINAKQNK